MPQFTLGSLGAPLPSGGVLAICACSMRACMHVLLFCCRSDFIVYVRAARKWRFSTDTSEYGIEGSLRFSRRTFCCYILLWWLSVLYFVNAARSATRRGGERKRPRLLYAIWLGSSAGSTCTQPRTSQHIHMAAAQARLPDRWYTRNSYGMWTVPTARDARNSTFYILSNTVKRV